MISTQNALWTPLIASFVPRYKCPVKKQFQGIYRSINSEFDISALLLFPLDSWYWRVKVNVHEKETNKLLTCLVVEAHTNTGA
ncbi:hypothetical protein ILUMI_09239 [Ignelater luminosus]|uniref:Uncharacterized protein n=1 Tax=Ignelater luminosus TaxID=2038154 RepID=A0A8K0D9L6_IGNLU|nr:hypothetical protein ILUMI_09239 [Ignelater luminosus]